MRVKLEKEYKRLYTLEQLDQARTVIQSEKENDDFTVTYGDLAHIYRKSNLQVDLAGAKRTYRRYLKEVKENLA